LSYISPATNSIQIYDLKKSQSVSIPYQSNIPKVWSPKGDALLYWDYQSQAMAIPHIFCYNLASGQKTNLGGSDHQEDYSAAWSPDGQWIAITRDNLAADGTTDGE
jgi:Tol biopolymer transport system component